VCEFKSHSVKKLGIILKLQGVLEEGLIHVTCGAYRRQHG